MPLPFPFGNHKLVFYAHESVSVWWINAFGSPFRFHVSDTIWCLSFPDFTLAFPSGSAIRNPPALQETWRHGFDPWVGKIPWRRKWQSTPIFLPRKSHGQRSLGAIAHGIAKESVMTEWVNHNRGFTSLSMKISKSIHMAATGISSFFLWLSSIPLWVWWFTY